MEQVGQLPLGLALALGVPIGGLEDGHQHGMTHLFQADGVQLRLYRQAMGVV